MSVRTKNSPAFEITLSKYAESAYLGFRDRSHKAVERGETSNYHITAFHMIRDAIRQIEANPTDSRYALAGDLSGIFRMKKGRVRICWVTSIETRAICILFISETLRKEGDKNDPYAIFTKMVMSGEFKNVFGPLGVPTITGGEDYQIQ
jgi:mRNA-degrading endonuclease RelE of RelBE toxin-antitoxin system